MNKLIIRVLSLLLGLSLVLGAGMLSASALTPSYNVSDEYKAGGYYDRLVAYELTGDYRYDVIQIALTQLGYHEGDSDADMDGLNIDGGKNFVEYNIMSGKVDNKEGNGVSYGYAWCASFVTWCLRQAKVSYTAATNAISCSVMMNWYVRNDIYYPSDSDYTPIAGDIIMFSNSSSPSHVGLVLGVQDGKVYTIEGNNGGKVAIHSYSLTDDYVLGYCVPKYSKTDKDYTSLLTDNINKTGDFIVNAKSLNVRSAPDNESDILGALEKNTTVEVTELSGSWGKIEFEGKDGWIYMPHTTDADYKIYTITYDLDGGEGVEFQRKLKGNTIIITESKPQKKGYSFVGWCDSRDGKEIKYKAGDVYTADEDITLYAVWTPVKYSVKFYDEDGTLLHEELCDYNDWVPQIEPPVKESDGENKYTFAGWDPEPAMVVVKNLEYKATYTATPLTDEEKAAMAQEGSSGMAIASIYWVLAGAAVAVIAAVVVLAVVLVKKKKATE